MVNGGGFPQVQECRQSRVESETSVIGAFCWDSLALEA